MPCITAQADAESQNILLIWDRTLDILPSEKKLFQVPNNYKNKQYVPIPFSRPFSCCTA